MAWLAQREICYGRRPERTLGAAILMVFSSVLVARGAHVPIAVECAHCGKQLKVKDELAGKKGKCPQCQKVIQIPAATAVAVGAGQGGAKKTPTKAPVATGSQGDSAEDIADSSANVTVRAP